MTSVGPASMSKIVAFESVTLDGVMQAPGREVPRAASEVSRR